MSIVNKILKTMDMELLNLEIQVTQIKNDASARGAMVAVEALRKEVQTLKKELES